MFRLVILVIAIFALGLMSVAASWDAEAFESENYYSAGGGKDGPYSLTYMGRGGGRCDGSDYRFRINVTRSYKTSDWKMYSSNSRYQRTPSSRPVYGYQLGGTSAHICIGGTEFNSILRGNGAWTAAGVQSNIYVWRR